MAIYNLLLPVASAAFRIAAHFDAKIARTLNARKGLKERWLSKSAELDKSRPVVWFHVSSVGEFLQARPVMDILSKKIGPSLQIALTFYSPSGFEYYENSDRMGKTPSIRFVDYLPFDTLSNARFCLGCLNPDLVVYVKYDLWPNLVAESSKRNIRQLLLSGTLVDRKRHMSGITGNFYKNLYSMISVIASVSDMDSGLFKQYLHPGVRVVTTGDIRFDQVCIRIDNATVSIPEEILSCEKRFIIAGSSWPKDEALIIKGFRKLLGRFDDTGLIIAPHEPEPVRIEEIEQSLEKEGLSSVRLSLLESSRGIDTDVIIADGLGYLAELYKAGTIAYVGGSWTTGVHNVMEPAVCGLPVFFGPKIGNAWEAERLIELGAAEIVRNADEFAARAGRLLADQDLLERTGRSASSFIRNHTGASMVCTGLIEELLE